MFTHCDEVHCALNVPARMLVMYAMMESEHRDRNERADDGEKGQRGEEEGVCVFVGGGGSGGLQTRDRRQKQQREMSGTDSRASSPTGAGSRKRVGCIDD